MAAHKAVLATRSGGVIDMVQHGENGFLIEPDVSALADGMRQMLKHPEETRKMGESAAQSIQRHTWAAVTDEFLSVFQRVVDSK
jgi:glycosyltransferase involved in cell wall biosynthesis